MTLFQYTRHAFSMTKREFFSGTSQLTLNSLILAVTIVCALSLTSSRIENAMLNQAADLIGGDRVIESTTAISDEIIELTKFHQLDYSQSVTLSSMLSAKENFQLSRLRAVDNNFPLKGLITVRDSLQATTDTNESNTSDSIIQQVNYGPKVGELWADAKLFDTLAVNIGDSVDVGAIALTLTKVLDAEPDQSGGFYSFFPKVLINSDDLAASKLLLPGSRLNYRLMVATTDTTSQSALDNWSDSVAPMLEANQSLTDPQNQSNRLSENLKKASTFINLGGLMAIILSGIAISLAATRHAFKHINQVALLRCLGLKSLQVNIIYTLQLAIICALATTIGLGLGYLIHNVLVDYLAPLFANTLPESSAYAWITGPVVAFIMLAGFALPPIFALAKTPPGRVLRSDNEKQSLQVSVHIIVAIIGLILIAWWQTKQLSLALIAIVGTVVLVAIMLSTITYIFKKFPKHKIKNTSLRSAYGNISARPWLSAIQIIGFGLSVFTIALVLYFRSDLFNQWQNELPEKAPNRFAFDILTEHKDEFQNALGEIGLQNNPIYPVVRGRLVKINGEVVQVAITKEEEQTEQQEESLSRDLALTQVSSLPFENTIIEGEFYDDINAWQFPQSTDNNVDVSNGDSKIYPVSVESELAKNIDVGIGDSLEFLIAGQPLKAQITSVREVNWQNFHPNFYMMFPDGALDDFSKTWLASFYLDNNHEKANTFVDSIINRFVGITIINVDDIITKIRQILLQVSAAMELIFFMTFLSGLGIFAAALLISFDEKQQQISLLRALGANHKTVAKRFMIEHAIIGFLSGILALASLLLVSFGLSYFVLDTPWQLSIIKWGLIPIILMVVLVALSRLQLNKILKTPPLRILR